MTPVLVAHAREPSRDAVGQRRAHLVAPLDQARDNENHPKGDQRDARRFEPIEIDGEGDNRSGSEQ